MTSLDIDSKEVGEGRHQRGSVLIGMIAILVLLGGLAVVMLRTTSTSTIGEVGANFAARAYYLAESGFRYVAGGYANGATAAAKAQALVDANGQTLTLTNDGQFQLTIRPYWLVTAQSYATGATSLAAAAPGEFASDFPIPGSVALKIGTEIYANCTVTLSPPSSATVALSSPGLTESLPQGTSIYLALYPSSAQTVASGQSLVLPAASAAMLPPRNGQLEIDLSHYFYEECQYDEASDTATLTNLRPGTGGVMPLGVSAATAVIFKKFTEIESTGSVPSGTMQVQRSIIYDTPIADLIEQPGQQQNDPVIVEEFQNLDNWDVPEGENRVSIQGYVAQGGTHEYWAAIRHLNTGDNRVEDPQNPPCKIGFYTLRLDSDSETTAALQQAWNDNGHLLSYDIQVKEGWGYLLNYGAAGVSFRWHANSGDPTKEEGFGLSFMRYESAATVCSHPNDGDYIPDAIKPPGLPGKLLLVLWQQQVAAGALERHWLAYAVLGSPLDRPGCRDPKAVGNQWEYDGRVNDNAALLLRVEEKRIDSIPFNDILVLYGDASTLYEDRTGNTVAIDLNPAANRLRYPPSWIEAETWPTWPPNEISDWTIADDYFTLASQYPPSPDQALFWTMSSAATGARLLGDGQTIRTATFTTSGLGSFPATRSEIGLHVFGELGGNFNESIAFDDFTAQLLGGYGGSSGGTFQPPTQR